MEGKVIQMRRSREQFTFKSVPEAKWMDHIRRGSGRIRLVYESGYIDNKDILVLGQMITLFGEPIYITTDVEQQFTYCISATNTSGETVYLTVYNCHGPAIGGDSRDPLSVMAADALAEYIVQAPVTDYNYVGCYTDGFTIVHEGVKQGEPYCWEESLDPEEMLDIIKELENGNAQYSSFMARFDALLEKGLYSLEEITKEGET